jgi:PadR family transcriptional regulator PadR
MRHRRSDHEGTGRGMEPFILLRLAEAPAYGYQLHKLMDELGFRRAAEDPSRVYKVLHDLEALGYLTSSWSMGDSGPARRTYDLTPDGKAYLGDRAEDLGRQAKRIKYFQRSYRRIFGRALGVRTKHKTGAENAGKKGDTQ